MLNDTIHRSGFCNYAACTCKRWRKDHDHPQPYKRNLPCSCIGGCKGHGHDIGLTDTITPIDVQPDLKPGQIFPIDNMETFIVKEIGDIHEVAIGQRQVGGSHYLDMKIQPWEIIRDSNIPIEQLIELIKKYPDFLYINYLRNTSQKHLKRAGNKVGTTYKEDIEKAFHYLEEAVARLKE